MFYAVSLLVLQVVDDILDFIASDGEMGKPTAADLRLGLATAPVLFACEQVMMMMMMMMTEQYTKHVFNHISKT